MMYVLVAYAPSYIKRGVTKYVGKLWGIDRRPKNKQKVHVNIGQFSLVSKLQALFVVYITQTISLFKLFICGVLC